LRIRLTVFARLLLILVGVSALPTALVVGVQERALVRDLEAAATARLERAGYAAAGLLDAHVEGLAERYRAISGTPQLRATLELGDEATLRFYAQDLAQREGAVALAIVSRSGEVVAAGEQAELATRPFGSTPVFTEDGSAYVRTEVPLRKGDVTLGSLRVVESLSAERLAEWSATCGAELALGSLTASGDGLVHVVREIGDARLTVATSLDAERETLSHARRNLLRAGGIALGLAFLASVFLSRGWVRPIVQMRHAADRVGSGDFTAHIETRRTDEIGDVTRAFTAMVERLHLFRQKVDEQQGALRQKVRELARSREGLRAAQRLARMGSWRFDPESGEVELSEELIELFGFAAGPVLPLKDLLASVHPDDRDQLVAAARRCYEEGAALHLDHRIVIEGGVERIVQSQARRVRDLDGETTVLEGTVQDVTDRKRAEEQVRFLAYHDGLTGLGNRRLCQERLELAVAHARRAALPLGVLILDLDHFKRINDTFGHAVGDGLLREIADRLVASVRASDMVARSDLATAISRFGGDEFTAVIGQVDTVQDLAKVARRLLDALSRPFTLEGHEIVISCSIGIAAWPADGDDADVLLRNADAAMYHAKNQGRNNYQFYAASMNEEALQRLILETRMRGALERSELEVHYQPKLDRDGCRVTGAEALVRWRDPELGMVMPNEFIPIAEETGLIGALGDWVLRRSCEDRRRWSEQGLPSFPISVNLSAHQFRGDGLPDRVRQILDETGLPPEFLELEITESTLLQDEAAVIEALSQLRRWGIRVAVDDFGTGYSSLAYLKRLPVDALKIDRSFVQGIVEDRGDAALAASIVAMGHALRLRVVAEGVETESQQRLLAEWGCDELQGFLLARPMPEPDFTAWWRRILEH
jgi:diguanylate cyclase (GGDEF)-like protein/PAS domain S-box-containing protein